MRPGMPIGSWWFGNRIPTLFERNSLWEFPDEGHCDSSWRAAEPRHGQGHFPSFRLHRIAASRSRTAIQGCGPGEAFAGARGDLRRRFGHRGGPVRRCDPANHPRPGAALQCRGAGGADHPQGARPTPAAHPGAPPRAGGPPGTRPQHVHPWRGTLSVERREALVVGGIPPLDLASDPEP